ncbi:M48 family metallopeptidase [Falsihalocynthiibacter sp. S25ZX9]|uniref:M48 family metallopeptidase n=1 Tax=Falsihalocynthiibacter sp. S25ZX9 TaxID=3240870 RepID=UPI00350FB1D0
MDRLLLPGEPQLEVTLRRSAQAKRLSLRVSRLDGRVTLTMPKRAKEREAIAFAYEKADWIRGHLVARPENLVPEIGGWVWFRGAKIPIVEGRGRAAKFVDGVIYVPMESQKVPIRVASFLKLAARVDLTEASEGFAHDLGVSLGRISLRDTRSRWGSCAHDGKLMYSWRLVMAPPYVLRYVAAHEVAHRLEMNHSADFWAVVERIFPDHKDARNWLRVHGEELHQFRFTD